MTVCRTERPGFGLLASFFDIKRRRQPAWRTCLQSGTHTGKDKGCISSANRLDRPWDPPAFIPWTPNRGAHIFPNSRRPFKNSSRQKCHIQQGPSWGPTYISRHRGDQDVKLEVTRYSAEVKNELNYTPTSPYAFI